MIIEEYDNNTGLPSVSTILSRYIYKGAFKDAHRERGHYVHQAVSGILKKEFVVIDNPAYSGYVRSFKHFAPCVKQVIETEKRYIDKLNSYTGKLDFLGVIDLEGAIVTALIDWKTSKSIYTTWPIALSGYRKLVEDNSDVVIDRHINVLLDEHGGPPKIKVWDPEQYKQHDVVFRSAKQIFYFFGEK